MFVNFNPSFGKVIPIKKIVINNDTSKIAYSQMELDIFEGQKQEQTDDSCSKDLSRKVIQSLNKILSKKDSAEPHTYKNALNNMIRNTMANVDSDYKIPNAKVEDYQNPVVRPCYSPTKNYILTGKDAAEYATSGKNIGGAKALVRDYDEDDSIISKSKRDFAYCKEDLLHDSSKRLKNKHNANLGLVIYADKIESAKKGSKGTKTDINIKGIDFEPLYV